ncbi:MAG: UvrD-helicase domain-containing protein [Pirellulales bacterium]
MSVAKPVSSLTPQQARAIDTRAVSVALSAGAGCGKTYVLTRRFLSHVDPEFSIVGEATEEPAGLEQLIAITFTERAAREMRERIRRETLNRLQTADEDRAGHWLDMLRGLDAARISTFHAFCGLLLRSTRSKLGSTPGFAFSNKRNRKRCSTKRSTTRSARRWRNAIRMRWNSRSHSDSKD